jgi:hypothetical protein
VSAGCSCGALHGAKHLKRRYVVVIGKPGKETGVVGGPNDGAGWTHDKTLANEVAAKFKGRVISATAYERIRARSA